MQAKRAIVRQHGGPEVIEFIDEEMPEPGPGEVVLEHTAIGLNYIDTYHRRGIYPMELPGGLGIEAAGAFWPWATESKGSRPATVRPRSAR